MQPDEPGSAADPVAHRTRPRSKTPYRVYHLPPPPEAAAAEPAAEPPPRPSVCPLCHGAGFVRGDWPLGHPRFGQAIACRCKVEERRQRHREDLWHLSHLDAVADLTFATFDPQVPGTRAAWEAARAYAADPSGWLVFSGSYGSGKTHLAAAIANQQFERGAVVLFVIVPRLLDHLRASYAPTSEVPYDDLFTTICDADLVVLDDLGAERATAWAQEKLFQLISHRSLYRLPTVITTNVNLRDALDGRASSRLADTRLVTQIHITAADYRRRPWTPDQAQAS